MSLVKIRAIWLDNVRYLEHVFRITISLKQIEKNSQIK